MSKLLASLLQFMFDTHGDSIEVSTHFDPIIYMVGYCQDASII